MTKLLIAYDNYNSYRQAKKHFRNIDINILCSYTPCGIEEDNRQNSIKHKPGRRLARCGIIFGIIGLLAAFYFQFWTVSNAYPLHIGGKPLISFMAFTPVAFECTVLFAAIGLIAMFMWYKQPKNRAQISELLSQDYFVIELESGQTINRQFIEETEPRHLKQIS